MIYTITLNPALDYNLWINDFTKGTINRPDDEDIICGGKGINVSCILNELEEKSIALGFVAGFTGQEIAKRLCQKGISTDFIYLNSGFTRINVKINSSEETQINGKGPIVNKEKLKELFDKTASVKKGDMLVLSGSVPKSLPNDIYEQIISNIDSDNIKCVIDTEGPALLNCLKYRPYLIKPNKDELCEIFSTNINSMSDIQIYAQKLQIMGAKNVIVSLGSKGAVLLDENKKFHNISAIKGKCINSVGAGDSMVAGFLAGIKSTGDYDYSLKLASAAGAATAFTKGLGTKELIYELFNKIK